MRSANGRAASACSCARLSLEAATSFIALVIFCVCLTLPIRVRRSLRLGIARELGAGSGERLGVAVEQLA